MQMLVSLTDTSNPAKTFTTPIPSVAPLLSREPGGRVRYINFAANVRNIERNQSGRKSGVRESTGDADRHKGTVEDVDPAGPRVDCWRPRKTALALLSRKQLDNLVNPTLWTTTAEAVKVRKSARKKRVYLTPLPQLAQRIVKSLLKDRDNARLFAQLSVYTTKAGRLNFDGKELAAQLIELGAPADFAYHTMRHTVTTFLQNDGVDEWSRGLILNHAGSGSVTGDYSHGYPLQRKRELLERWASHVEQLVQPEGVTLLR